MASPDKHDKTHHELFDENTAQVGSLGGIVEAHSGDSLFLADKERSAGGADGGESDFEAEMLATDPADDSQIDPRDMYADEDQIWSTDQSGTVEGIARGFGTHLPQDIGRGGFQVEEIPASALAFQNRIVLAGEELDDYDNADDSDGKFDSGPDLAHLSEPGRNRVDRDESEAMPGRMHIHKPRPRDADDLLDATREIQ
jgi:hypothetical protein